MSEEQKMDSSRRNLLVATSVVGGVGVAATAVPFVTSLAPSNRARALGAAVEVDISQLAPGEMTTVEWRGSPVWILHRTPEMIESLNETDDRVADPDSERDQQPEYAKNQHRSIKPEFFVAVGICTHLGCSPSRRFETGAASGIGDDWVGGFFCPCHGSYFDLAGRVFRNMPAPANLVVPPYTITENTILVGEDDEA